MEELYENLREIYLLLLESRGLVSGGDPVCLLLRELEFLKEDLADCLGDYLVLDYRCLPEPLIPVKRCYQLATDIVSQNKVADAWAKVARATELLEQIVSWLGKQNKLSLKQYAYDDFFWMPVDFIDALNSANLEERWVLIGEAVAHWNALHSHLGRSAPVCPLFDPCPQETDPEDF